MRTVYHVMIILNKFLLKSYKICMINLQFFPEKYFQIIFFYIQCHKNSEYYINVKYQQDSF